MRYIFGIMVAGLALTLTRPAFAQAPAGATAQCRDNSYYTGASHRGACARHGGVQQWLATQTAAPPAKSASANPAPAPSRSTARRSPSATAPGPATPTSYNSGDRVWVNTSSKVYHCPNDPWYGKTTKGEYMDEAQAKADGYRPDHNRACAI